MFSERASKRESLELKSLFVVVVGRWCTNDSGSDSGLFALRWEVDMVHGMMNERLIT